MLPAEPRSIGGIVDAGVTLYRQTIRATLPLAAIGALLYALTSAGLTFLSSALDPATQTSLEPVWLSKLFVLMLLMYLSLFFLLVSVGHRQITLARGGPLSLRADIGRGLVLALPLLVLAFLYVLAIMLGLLLLIVPGMILMVSLSLFAYVPIVEQRSVWGALGRSHSLVWHGNWTRTMVVLSIMGVISVAVAMLAYLALGATAWFNAAQGTSAPLLLAEALSNFLMMCLLMPLSSAIVIALYHDLLLRKEGSDLDARIQSLGAGGAV